MTSTLQSEALEQAWLVIDVERGPGFLGRLQAAVAAALLRARAEEVRSLGLYHREAELRAAADALEGK